MYFPFLIFISQLMFPNNDHIRSIRRNSNYLTIFRNPSNQQDILHLSNQMGQNLKTAYNLATVDPFTYLFICVTQECLTDVRYMSHIFDHNHIVRVYLSAT